MNNELYKQIYSRLNQKGTDELLEIWRSNDRAEWSDTAFEVIEKILQERVGEIPSQGAGINTGQENLKKDSLPDWEAKLLDDSNQPEFYDTIEVLELRDNIEKTTRAMIVIFGLSGLLSFSTFRFYVSSFFFDPVNNSGVIDLIAFGITVLSAGVTVALSYFPLKALTHILRILMEMEFRSRHAG